LRGSSRSAARPDLAVVTRLDRAGGSRRGTRPTIDASHVSRCRFTRPASAGWSGRLQGLAPSTGPLRSSAVASTEALVPSMGFVPPRGPSLSAPYRLLRCARLPRELRAGRPPTANRGAEAADIPPTVGDLPVGSCGRSHHVLPEGAPPESVRWVSLVVSEDSTDLLGFSTSKNGSKEPNSSVDFGISPVAGWRRESPRNVPFRGFYLARFHPDRGRSGQHPWSWLIFEVCEARDVETRNRVCASRCARLRVVVFPAPSSAFGRHRPGPSRTPGASPARQRATWRVDLRDLHLSFDAPAHGWEPLANHRDRDPDETWIPSSLGVRPLFAPPPTYRPRVHSRRPKPPSGRRHHPFRLLFRPRGFSPPRRLPPRSGCGFVAPRYRSGVRRVSRRRFTWPPERGVGEPTSFPATRAHTLRRVPPVESRTTSPRLLAFTVAVALLPLPPDPRGDRGRRAVGRASPRRGRAHGVTGTAEADSMLPPLRAARRRDPLVAS